VSVVNALSDWLRLRIWRGGKAYQIVPPRRRRRPAFCHWQYRSARHRGPFHGVDGDLRRVECHYDILAKRIRELSLSTTAPRSSSSTSATEERNFAYSGGIRGFVST
jgi:DNA gyrase subunit B